MLQDSPELRPFVLSNVQLTGTRIGAGAYGSVEEVTIHGAVCAAKKIHDIFQDRSEIQTADIQKASSQFVRECQLMSTLRHPHIVQFLGVCFLHGSQLPALVMERLMTSLHDLLDPETDPPPPPDAPKPFFPLSLKCSILHNVASGLAYLHERSEPIIHRDLSARNVLVNSGMVAKIADLGVARIVPREYMRGASTMTKAPGASIYMPPEALEAKSEEEEQRSRYDASIDVFSFGVVSIFTLSQTFPCNLLAHNYREGGRHIARTELERRAQYMQMIYRQLCENHPLLQMIERCLDFPENRPSIGEVLRLLDQARAEERDERMEMNKLELVRALQSQPNYQGVEGRQGQEGAETHQHLQCSEMEKETLRPQLMRKEAELIRAQETIKREQQRIQEMEETIRREVQAKDKDLAQAQEHLRQQEQSNKMEISDLKRKLQSSEALVADFQNTLQQRDSELEASKPKVNTHSQQRALQERSIVPRTGQSAEQDSQTKRSGSKRGGVMGPWKSIFVKKEKEMRILMVGLNAAGKTTILYKLKLGEIVAPVPTRGSIVETILYSNINLIVTEVGGGDENRPSWSSYYPNTEGLIFVVDSNDRERMGEARGELHRMLAADELRGAPLLVFANKQDLHTSMHPAEITSKLGLKARWNRHWHVQIICAITGDGLYEGIDWLLEQLKRQQK